MSRFGLEPPDDDADVPRVRCCEVGCHNDIDVPEREVFCYECRCRHLQQIARATIEANADAERTGAYRIRKRRARSA